MAKKSDEPVIVQTVEKAIHVLEALADAPDRLGVTDVARRIDDNPSTVYRILSTLSAYGLVEQDPGTSRYGLGVGLLRLSGRLWQSMDLRTIARPVLEQLRDDTGETVNLLIRDGTHGIYVDTVESNQSIRRVGAIGRREPLHASGVGKAVLAYLPNEDYDSIVAAIGLERFTPNTITDAHALREHLRVVRQRGFAVDDEEAELGTRCIGAPIFGRSGGVEAALSISGPATRMNRERIDSHAKLAVTAAAEISHRLGFGGKHGARD